MMIADMLKRNGAYSDADIQLFKRETKIRDVAKNEMLITPGEVCRSVFYTLRGAFYQYKHKNGTDENVIDLHIEHEWFLLHNSFISQQPADSFLRAYAESKLLQLDIETLHWLILKSPAFLQLGKVPEQANSRVRFFDDRLTPVEKYRYLLSNRPALIQAFPLKMIASYLKIAPETLSRVRESILQGG